MDLPRPFFLKKSLFYKLFAWQVANFATPFSFKNFIVYYQVLQMSIICFCSIISSHSIWRKTKLMFEVCGSNWSPLYLSCSQIVFTLTSQIIFDHIKSGYTQLLVTELSNRLIFQNCLSSLIKYITTSKNRMFSNYIILSICVLFLQSFTNMSRIFYNFSFIRKNFLWKSYTIQKIWWD